MYSNVQGEGESQVSDPQRERVLDRTICTTPCTVRCLLLYVRSFEYLIPMRQLMLIVSRHVTLGHNIATSSYYCLYVCRRR